jgi:hypothetical protein
VVHLTYVGGCPGAVDPAIDLRVPPDAFLRGLAGRGIVVEAQPTEFTDQLPPDRRRFRSVPGGAPAGDVCETLLRRALVVPAPGRGDPRLALADALLQGGAAFIDPGPLHGCLCAAAQADPRDDRAITDARPALVAIEPPRAARPVLASDPALDLRPTDALLRERVRDAAPRESSATPASVAPTTPPVTTARSVAAAPPTVAPTPASQPRPPRPLEEEGPRPPRLRTPAAHPVIEAGGGAGPPVASARSRFALAAQARRRHVTPASSAVVDPGATGDTFAAAPLEREVPLVPHDEGPTAPATLTAFLDGILGDRRNR